MLSRVAENLYWMSRYIERAENIARIIDVNYNLMLDSNEFNSNQQWQPLVVTSGDDEEFEKHHTEYNEKNVISFLTFDERNSNSILSCISSTRFNAKTARESISPEMFHEINDIYHKVNALLQFNPSTKTLKNLYDEVIKFSHLFIGLTERTLLQDEGWNFIRLGRLLERADKITRILDIKYFILLPSVGYVNTPYDDIQWAALLKSASAFEPYRKKYHTIEYDKIIEFLIREETFPRSVNYCLRRLLDTISKIDETGGSLSFLKIRELSKEIENISVKEIKHYGLHEYLDIIQQKLNDIGNAIYKDFFFLTYS
jgi:uncharacterized alpha-E superfamily protein